jgi:hypothetical protein
VDWATRPGELRFDTQVTAALATEGDLLLGERDALLDAVRARLADRQPLLLAFAVNERPHRGYWS